MKMFRKNKKGFTLIELLVVIIMIGALTGIGISVINPTASRGRARDGIRNKNVKSLSEAIESYKQLENKYPANGDDLDENSLLRTVYIKKWPEAQADDGSIDEDNWMYEYTQMDSGDGCILFSPNSTGKCFKYQTNWARVLECPKAECSTAESLESDCN